MMERKKVQDCSPEEVHERMIEKIFATSGYCPMCNEADWDPNEMTLKEKQEYCISGTCPDCQKQLFSRNYGPSGQPRALPGRPEPQDYDEAQLQDLQDRRDAYRKDENLVAIADFMDDGTIQVIRTRACQIEFGTTLSKTRLSWVEQDENGAWWATVLPDGPTLGPAKTYSAAIQEEMQYFSKYSATYNSIRKMEENHDRSSNTN